MDTNEQITVKDGFMTPAELIEELKKLPADMDI